MAFDRKALGVLAYSAGFTLWHYRTADPLATLAGANYFGAAADQLRGGDMIVAVAADGTALAPVASVAAGVVAMAATKPFPAA